MKRRKVWRYLSELRRDTVNKDMEKIIIMKIVDLDRPLRSQDYLTVMTSVTQTRSQKWLEQGVNSGYGNST